MREIKLNICYTISICSVQNVNMKRIIKSLSQITIDIGVSVLSFLQKNVSIAINLNQSVNRLKKDYSVIGNVIHCGGVSIVREKKHQTIKMVSVVKDYLSEHLLNIESGVRLFFIEIIILVRNVEMTLVEIWKQTISRASLYSQSLGLILPMDEHFVGSVIN